MLVKLEKALYGCVESAKLWYDHLSGTLLKMGFVKNSLDPCVFNKDFDGKQCTICIYVDDCLVTCETDAAIEEVIDQLRSTYKTIEVGRGDIHSYLGMTLDFSTAGQAKITMEHYVSEALKAYDVTGHAKTPAAEFLFEVRESPALREPRREEFHSRVAKMLYLAKRVRPDLLTACVYLASRVQSATEDDWAKLDRLLRYLNSTRELGIVLSAQPGQLQELAYIDASYGVHHDAKSHTGVVISLGAGPIFVKSAKQKIVTKSSTEAELVGISDALSTVIWIRQFLQQQGHDMGPATVYQDNTSTIALAEKGRAISERTRHINIRHFFVNDRIANGEIVVVHKPTAEMVSDILTKPLQGSLFLRLRQLLLNWI